MPASLYRPAGKCNRDTCAPSRRVRLILDPLTSPSAGWLLICSQALYGDCLPVQSEPATPCAPASDEIKSDFDHSRRAASLRKRVCCSLSLTCFRCLPLTSWSKFSLRSDNNRRPSHQNDTSWDRNSLIQPQFGQSPSKWPHPKASRQFPSCEHWPIGALMPWTRPSRVTFTVNCHSNMNAKRVEPTCGALAAGAGISHFAMGPTRMPNS